MSKEHHILVVGSDGIIGGSLADHLHNQGLKVTKTSRRQDTDNCLFLDLSKPVAKYELPEDLSTAYICAAMTSFEQCRLNPAETYLVNVKQTEILAKQLVSLGTRVIFLSSNAVYDGSKPYRLPNEPTCPTTEYGKQKAEAEKQLLALAKQVTIVRLTKVLTTKLSLLSDWIKSLKTNTAIHPRSDMTLAPLSLQFVVANLARLIDQSAGGILHLSGKTDTTYDEVGKEIAKHLGVDDTLVRPISKEPGNQPKQYTTLDMSAFAKMFNVDSPDLTNVIGSLLAEK